MSGADIHENAVKKGFWDLQLEFDDLHDSGDVDDAGYAELSFVFYGKQFMMIVSEVAEAMEAVRKSMGPNKVEEEFADIYIRMLDLYEGLRKRGVVNRSLKEATNDKININAARKRLHGNLG